MELLRTGYTTPGVSLEYTPIHETYCMELIDIDLQRLVDSHWEVTIKLFFSFPFAYPAITVAQSHQYDFTSSGLRVPSH